jgi:protein-tyrosine kinase
LDKRDLPTIEQTGRVVTALDPSERIRHMAEVRLFDTAELDQLKILHPGTRDREQLKIFRDLRTRIFKKAGNRNFLCLVTSLVEGGGASYVASNLAAAIALDRTKTSLLVDCNLYSPSADRLLAAPADQGLTDLLDSYQLGVESVVYASGIPRVRVVPAGHKLTGGTEMLTTPRMRAFVEEVKNRYSDRFVVFDSPPVNEYSAETRILADLCDFVVLVVPAGRVTETQINEGIAAVGGRLAGLVFNNSY